MATWKIVCADVLEWCKNYTGLPFHAILTDPPYHLHSGGKGGFMGKEWDGSNNIAFQPSTWAALAEHLLPGGFVFAFASSRGWHRLACALEDAGLIIQPSIFIWLNAQSFPKASRLDKKLDEMAGKLNEREMIGAMSRPASTNRVLTMGRPHHSGSGWQEEPKVTAPATDLARAWEGHRYGGQILKNCAEPIIVAQKPWEGKRLDCIVETGVGSLWVDGGRIGVNDKGGWRPSCVDKEYPDYGGPFGSDKKVSPQHPQGRWPSNFALCHSEGCERVGVKRIKGITGGKNPHKQQAPIGTFQERETRPYFNHADPDGYERVDEWQCVEECPARKLGEQSGQRPVGGTKANRIDSSSWFADSRNDPSGGFGDKGTAARFFYQADWSHEIAERIANADPVRYCPKAARKERANGLDDFHWRKDKAAPIGFVQISREEWETLPEKERAQGNIHPTCKPISLNKWLATLLLPPKEYAPRRILIPFCGTMSEGIGALLADWEEIVGIDSEQDYCDIGEARMEFWLNRPQQLELP